MIIHIEILVQLSLFDVSNQAGLIDFHRSITKQEDAVVCFSCKAVKAGKV